MHWNIVSNCYTIAFYVPIHDFLKNEISAAQSEVGWLILNSTTFNLIKCSKRQLAQACIWRITLRSKSKLQGHHDGTMMTCGRWIRMHRITSDRDCSRGLRRCSIGSPFMICSRLQQQRRQHVKSESNKVQNKRAMIIFVAPLVKDANVARQLRPATVEGDCRING